VIDCDYESSRLFVYAKGVKMQERGLWDELMLLYCNTSCVQGRGNCAQGILAMEPDFRAQRYIVAEIIESHGHRVAFLPKYHHKLNPVEYVWGHSMIYAKQNCSYSLPAL
jgi:hypothetical protein